MVTGDEWFETAWDGLGAAGRTGFGNSGLIGLASATCLPRRRYRVELKSKDASSLGSCSDISFQLIPAYRADVNWQEMGKPRASS